MKADHFTNRRWAVTVWFSANGMGCREEVMVSASRKDKPDVVAVARSDSDASRIAIRYIRQQRAIDYGPAGRRLFVLGTEIRQL